MKKRALMGKWGCAVLACAAAVMISACGGGGSEETQEPAENVEAEVQGGAVDETGEGDQQPEEGAPGAENLSGEESGKPEAEEPESEVSGDGADSEKDAGESASEEAETQGSPAAGVWDEEQTVCTDAYAGVQFTMPEGWIPVTQEQMAQLGGDTAGSLYAMMAVDLASGSNVITLYEDLEETAGILAGSVDEDVYIESLRGQLEAQGIVPGEEVEEKSIGSQTYHCLSAITESEGVVMNQYYLLRKIDSHMFCILITAQEDETADEYIAMFAEV